jgi:sugar lactone lactonase YvrE
MNVRTSLVGVLCAFALSPSANAWDRGEATTFARLPRGTGTPEGITVDENGNVYVTQFDLFDKFKFGIGQLFIFDRDGRLVRQVSVHGSSPALLGLDFNPTTHALLVIDFGQQQVLAVDDLKTGAAHLFTKVPKPGAGLNALTFDSAGNVYISDSFGGTIWKTGPTGGAATAWVTDAKLTTVGKPPFGANGIAFNKAQTAMFVANTGDDTIVKIPVVNGTADQQNITVFTNSINGADGLAIDEDDNIWVCANQSDEIVVVDKTGKAIAKLGDFDGIRHGEPHGLLFPASLVFTGDSVLVTNLALNTAAFGFNTVDTGWSQQVQTFTVARIRRRIPHVNADRD